MFLWQSPLNPKGQITEYRIDLTYSSTGGYMELPPVQSQVDATTFYYVLRREEVPANVVATITVSATGGVHLELTHSMYVLEILLTCR